MKAAKEAVARLCTMSEAAGVRHGGTDFLRCPELPSTCKVLPDQCSRKLHADLPGTEFAENFTSRWQSQALIALWITIGYNAWLHMFAASQTDPYAVLC